MVNGLNGIQSVESSLIKELSSSGAIRLVIILIYNFPSMFGSSIETILLGLKTAQLTSMPILC